MSQGPGAVPLRIGVSCFPTYGGSGIIATEIGLSLARRGHQVHFLCYEAPGRLAELRPLPPRVHLHPVEVLDYPLPHLSLYPLALASVMAEVIASERLDVLHVHYALPHATSALLARQLVAKDGGKVPRLITTLHGTDVTILSPRAALRPVVRHSLLQGDGLTVPSSYLRQAAETALGLPLDWPIEVIPNFVDTDRFRPGARPAGAPAVLLHGSNFRPIKRVDDVVRVFAGVRQALPAELILLGDGPERPRVEALVEALGLSGSVRFLGLVRDVAAVLGDGDLFLLPSQSEGFGLAALEALACGVPVVAARVGGVPEVVLDGETGLLCPPGDVAGMTAAALRILGDPALHGRMRRSARLLAERSFQQEPMVDRYEALYRRVLDTTVGRRWAH